MGMMSSELERVRQSARISVIIPTKNEVKGIGSVLRGIWKVLGEDGEIIVIDEYSTDGTVEKALRTHKNVRIFQRKGTGKGNGIQTGVQVFTGDIFVILDSDATFDPMDIPRVIEPILSNRADVVLGSRFKGRMEKGAMSFLHRLGNYFFNLLINLKCARTRVWITDSQTGLRAMRREVIRSLNVVSEGYDIETELTIKCLKNGYRTIEVPINFHCRKGNSKSKLKTFSDGRLILRRIFNG